ncbi:DUF87 domain-containing protein [Sulfurimonas aquatica]|uniref:DUF87 domain-containing protein n=1 Tax=Sulfurimonas aquatica TaxID=2672570 RepID=A0A975B1Z3_9BACT|nr:DUF87 domain-containing protein [Sulfurimonas aquatica]QSZ42670.1 DUF87 domain-containing protein [Sulfurimonas aquatica]
MKELYEKMGLFYLGKNENEDLTLYKSKHLTTHAMLIGMTGSGKTGLGIGLIEEAAIDNIPSIIIDPKGDMGNLCLAFPNLEAKEFEPWLEKPEMAEKMATMWRDGLTASGQDSSRVQKFAEVEKTIYTPGSSAGVGVNILGSFSAPSQEVLEDNDTLTSLINASVSSLLALLSIEADPINSKEHLLLSNIFHHCYLQGISLSLEEIIGYIATPPFEKIGIMSLKTFYPQKERMKLAMALNGVISSISFSSWLEGEALDIQNMLYDENGNAKVAIFSIAHLSDSERMFFVTILLNTYISWMRAQSGSSSLKSLLYMDEIFGFFPPSKNPPSKEPMLLLLKQARAFGTGVILSTQNPVDLDYKGLSNIGTWFVGKLQTKQDIDKVLEPLMAKSKLSKEEIRHKLATLKGRHFFLKNVHSEATLEFSTRWVLSYLKGPMTKDDIKRLMQSKKETFSEVVMPKAQKKASSISNKEIINESIKEYFLDTNINGETPFYPYIYAKTKVRFFNQKRVIDIIKTKELKLELYESQTTLEWSEALDESLSGVTNKKTAQNSFAKLPKIITQLKTLKTLEKSLSQHFYTSQNIELFSCKQLKLESKIDQSKKDFIVEVEDRLKDLRDEKLEKLEARFESKFTRLHDKLKKLEMRLQKEQSDVSSKTSDTLIDVGLALFGAFFGKKSSSGATMRKGASAFKKGKGVLKERNDVKNIESLIQDTEEKLEELKIDLDNEVEAIEDAISIDNYEITSFFIKPRRSDIIIEDIAILWER